MFEFIKLCDAFERLSAVEKAALLIEKSTQILAKLHTLSIPGIDPVETLAGFIIGSVIADGHIDEREYLLIYPSLVDAFGADFDFVSIKSAFRCDGDVRRMIAQYTERMLKVLDFLDEDLKADVITLCLCIVAIDGKVSLKEKKYIRRLCRA